VVNPIISPEDGKQRLGTVNTELICLRKNAWNLDSSHRVYRQHLQLGKNRIGDYGANPKYG
jgi:hypothetical protein